MMTPKQFNDWRIFPRIGMIFMGIMFVWFNIWFFSVSVTEMSEWHLVQYATVAGAYIGLWKFYFETGNKLGND